MKHSSQEATSKIFSVVDTFDLPVTVYAPSVSPHEVTLVEQFLKTGFLNEIPARLIGDKAYTSDGLDQRLQEEDWDIEMIAPHRSDLKRPKSQDGRSLGRYRGR